MAADPFRQLDVIRNASKHGKRITDCYRLMYKKELWIKAYTKLYPCAKGKMDGLILQKADQIVELLKAGTFRFPTVKRGTITNLKDILVQEVIRIILENIYEPVFSDNSHGFRQGRNCHTALAQIKNTWAGLTWVIKGEIQGLFEAIDHSVLLKLISKKIADHRFLLLLHNALLSGVTGNWISRKQYSATPQRGTLSSLLGNIYLHEFDLFMEKQMKVPSACSLNHNAQRMKYVRYADEFVAGIAGSKQNALKIKEAIEHFLKGELHLELNEEKTGITHLKNPISFLGYEFCNWNKKKVTETKPKGQKLHLIKRTRPEIIKLEISNREIKKFFIQKGYGNLDNCKITHRANLVNHSELAILDTYNTEIRVIANYYKLADDFHHLDKWFYLAESSFIKTLASKRRSTSKKVAESLRTHKQGVLCIVRKDTVGKEELHPFIKLKDLKNATLWIK